MILLPGFLVLTAIVVSAPVRAITGENVAEFRYPCVALVAAAHPGRGSASPRRCGAVAALITGIRNASASGAWRVRLADRVDLLVLKDDVQQ